MIPLDKLQCDVCKKPATCWARDLIDASNALIDPNDEVHRYMPTSYLKAGCKDHPVVSVIVASVPDLSKL